MEYLMFILIVMLFISVVILEKESIERDKKLRRQIYRLGKKSDALALYIYDRGNIYEKRKKSKQIRRKEQFIRNAKV